MLELRHVSCRYDDRFVLKDISVLIEDGGLVGLIGPNGSGKTTLIRAVTGTIGLAEGEVLLKGKPLGILSLRELARQVAVVGRLHDIDMHMRVEDLVLLGRIPHRKGLRLMERKSDLDVAGTAMDVTGTSSLKDRFLESLSSGERQLAFIARALAQEPELLLLDEPTSHLDIGHQARVLDLVRKLNRDKGLTILIVLHDLNLASQYCDRILLLADGVLRKDGTPDEVLTYRNIGEVYHTAVAVMKNPVSSKPGVFLVPEADAFAGVEREAAPGDGRYERSIIHSHGQGRKTIDNKERSIMDTEKRDFDKEAASWDERPYRVKLAKDIADAITGQIPVTSDMDVMDFGCGTGLLTLRLQPLVHSVTGVDSSRGMVEMLTKKITEMGPGNVRAMLVDLDKGDTLTGNYDLIVSNMTLHHVKDVQPLLDRFHDILAPSGYLCIADLDLEEGRFHENNIGVFHFGFDRTELRRTFEDAGFDNVRDVSATTMTRQTRDGEMREFTIFLMTGRKRRTGKHRSRPG